MKKGTICFLLVLAVNFILSLIFSESGLIEKGFWAQIIFTMVLYLAYFLVIFFVVRMDGEARKPKEFCNAYQIKFRMKWGDAAMTVLLGLICICSFLLFQYASIELFQLAGWKGGGSAMIIDGWGQYVACVFALAVMPAIVEELLFRGVILQGLKKYGAVIAILASAVLFSFYHLNPAQTIYQFILGLVFAGVVVYSGNLIVSMLLHFVNNFAILTYTFIAGTDEMMFSWNAYTIVTTVVLAVIGAYVIWKLIKTFARNNPNPLGQWQRTNKRFVDLSNLGYFLCIAVVGALWIATLLV